MGYSIDYHLCSLSLSSLGISLLVVIIIIIGIITAVVADIHFRLDFFHSSFFTMAQGVRDGGWGWCVMCCSFLVHLVVGGIAYSGGIYYLKLIEKFEENEFLSAWTGSLLMGMTAFGGQFFKLLRDHSHCV